VARLNLNAVTQWITAAAVQHPDRLAAELAARCDVSLPTARRKLMRLVELHWLAMEGTSRRRSFRPGLLRQVVRRYALDGLQEDLPWALDFAPYFTLPPAVQRMVQHAFCELLNNAIDHSGGTQVTVSLRQTASHVQLLVSDDGRGLFRQIADTFAIDDPRLAMLELSKGKLTSQPRTHTGQGLFFTSRLADVLDLHANEHAFQQREWDGRGWHRQRALKHQGTSVYASIALDTPRTLDAVRKAYSVDGEGLGFDRTVVPLRLLASATIGLESRAQARRVAARLQDFQRADVDFGGVADVGHGFADELFRVLTREQPGLALNAVNMTPAVAAMIASIRASGLGRMN
jgi:anti-sigma regulatory factor (Ser/Thr protein kinase)